MVLFLLCKNEENICNNLGPTDKFSQIQGPKHNDNQIVALETKTSRVH